jgi:hypothetical protein
MRWLVLACAAFGLTGCAELSDDARLLVGVKAAASRGIPPDQVEAVVGRQAVVNTFKTEHGDRALERLSFAMWGPRPDVPDRLFPSPAAAARYAKEWTHRLYTAQEVVCWVRPVEGRPRKLVGIAWHDDGEAEVFFGVVSPP